MDKRAFLNGYLKKIDKVSGGKLNKRAFSIFGKKPEPEPEPATPPQTEEEWTDYAQQAYELGRIDEPTPQAAKEYWQYRKEISDILAAHPLLFQGVTRYAPENPEDQG